MQNLFGLMDGMATMVVMADIPFPFFPLLSFVFDFRRFSGYPLFTHQKSRRANWSVDDRYVCLHNDSICSFLEV